MSASPLWLLAFGAVLTSCGASPYKCESNASCVNSSGGNGVCELDGFCSFPDTACPTGERYDESAGASGCVAVSPDACVQQISVGIQFSCLLRTDGTVWCWGYNNDGELGNDSVTASPVPVEVKGLPDASSLPVVSISTAEEHACALVKDGSVWCWGINDQLNLGQCPSGGAVPANSTTALRIPKWQVGSGSAAPSCVAGEFFEAALPSGDVVNTLTAGGEHSCAIGADSQLYCWGEDVTGDVGGQAGQDFTIFGSGVPGPLVVTGATALPDAVVDVQAGDDFSCLLLHDNSVWCWGGNQLGELASSLASSDSPVTINGLGDSGHLQVDDETGCVLGSTSHEVSCWGNGTTGIFGPAGDDSSNKDAATQLLAASNLYGGPSAETLCLSEANGGLQCWGDNGNGESAIGALTPVNLDAPTNAQLASVTQLRIGQFHACALTGDGSVWCWGDNTYGELGNNAMSTTPTPTPVRVQVVCQ
jgi:alpha-tubulin suppressor-like RCC1 family protein